MALLNIIFYSSILCLTAGAVFSKNDAKIVFDDGIYTSGNDVYNSEEQGLLTEAKVYSDSIPAIADFNGTLAWNYEDQGKWGATYPRCNGDKQSPINIRNGYIKKRGKSCLVFENYGKEHTAIKPLNLGITVEFHGPFGTNKSAEPTLSGGPLIGTYRLANVHFHWGYDNTDGSEHAINSQKLPMEMHLVHYNTDFNSTKEALASGRPDALAVIGVLFKPSNSSDLEVSTLVNTVDDARLGNLSYPITFPLNIVQYKTNYFTYLGSLTTPECNESVRWIVFETPLNTKTDEFEVFRAFKVNGKPLVDNFRTTQPMNGRELIRYSC